MNTTTAAGWFLVLGIALILVIIIRKLRERRIPCPQCGERIPKGAKLCRYCRSPVPTPPPPRRGLVHYVALALVTVIIVLILLGVLLSRMGF